mmetsp:Transcript_11254/g.14898  ORF Transcript_11254/g.14898 Transcript_11254/m.14898 type:complete len:86 (-) Transcript_11254:248-505(-)
MELSPRDRALGHRSPRAPTKGSEEDTSEQTMQTELGGHLTEAVIVGREVVSMILEAAVTFLANVDPKAGPRGQRIRQPRKFHVAK